MCLVAAVQGPEDFPVAVRCRECGDFVLFLEWGAPLSRIEPSTRPRPFVDEVEDVPENPAGPERSFTAPGFGRGPLRAGCTLTTCPSRRIPPQGSRRVDCGSRRPGRCPAPHRCADLVYA